MLEVIFKKLGIIKEPAVVAPNIPKTIKNVSEPIISFCNTLQQQPKRFKLISCPANRSTQQIKYYQLHDKKTGEIFSAELWDIYRRGLVLKGDNKFSLSSDEETYLTENLINWLDNRKSKIHNRKSDRRKLKNNIVRARLTTIYEASK